MPFHHRRIQFPPIICGRRCPCRRALGARASVACCGGKAARVRQRDLRVADRGAALMLADGGVDRWRDSRVSPPARSATREAEWPRMSERKGRRSEEGARRSEEGV
eukprot:1588470-Pyramimonas_sp.AAC.1